MDLGAFGKGKGKQSKGNHGKGKGKGKQGQQGQHGQDKDKSNHKTRDSVECWNCGKRGHYSKDCWSKKNTKGGLEGKHKAKNATDAHSLDSTKPANDEPEVEIGGFNMCYLDVHSVEVRGSECIEIGVDTGAGKTAWPQGVTHGKTIPGDSDLTFQTQQLENLSRVASECKLWVATIGDPISEFEENKRRSVNHCCLWENTRRWVESRSCMVTKVTCSTKVRMLRKKWMLGSRRR